MIKQLIILTFSLGCALPVSAEVYLLRPDSSSSSHTNADFQSAFSPEQIFFEEPVINGVKLKLSVSLLPLTFEQLVPQLKELFPNAKIKAGHNCLLLISKTVDSWQDRLLIVGFGRGKALMQFHMRVPEKLPDNFDLPSELTLPAGVTAYQHIYFPKRAAHYAKFTFSGSGTNTLREFDTLLRADNWQPVSGEANAEYDGRGEIYLRKSPPAIMLVNCAKSHSGFIYYSPCVKRP